MSKSIAELQQQLETTPKDVQAFEALEQIFIEQGEFQRLVELYENSEENMAEQLPRYWMRVLRHVDHAVSRETEAEVRGRLFLLIGRVYEEHLDRVDQANASYQQAYRVYPKLSEALDRARAIYSRAGNWDLVLRLWEMQARNDRSPQAQADVFAAMGRVCLDHIGDGARATDFARRALTQVPEHAAAQKVLDDHADMVRDWQGEVAVLVEDARDIEDVPTKVEAFQDILRFVVERVPLGKVEGAPIVGELTALDPANVNSWVLARSWYDRAGNAEAAEEAHRPLLGLLDGQDRIDALYQAATRAHDVANAPNEIAARRALLRVASDDLNNFQALERIVSEEGLESTRLAIYEDAIETGTGDRVEILEKAAQLAKALEKFDVAEQHFANLHEDAPENLDAIEYLHHRAVERQDAAAQAELAVKWASLIDGEEAAARWAEAATLADEQLHQPDRAIEAWRRRGDILQDDVDTRVALRSLYERTEDIEALTQLLEYELTLAEPIDEPNAIKDALIHHYANTLHHYDAALGHLHDRVNGEPDDEALGESLRRVARLADNMEDIRRDLHMRIENSSEENRFVYVDSLARLELELEQPASALPWLNELVQDDRTGLDLLYVRRDMAIEKEETDLLIDIQERITRRLPEGSDASDAYLELATYAEKARNFETAYTAYNEVMQRQGDAHEVSRHGVMRSLEALERWAELADVMDIELQHAPAAETHVKLAHIAEIHLQDADRAAAQRNAALDLDASDQESGKKLIAHYAERWKWDDIERIAIQADLHAIGWESAFDTWKEACELLAENEYAESELAGVYTQLKRWAQSPLDDVERVYRVAALNGSYRNDEQAWIEAANSAQEATHMLDAHGFFIRGAHAANDPEHIATYWSHAADLAQEQDDIPSDGWEERAHAWEATPSVKERRDLFAKSSIETQRIDQYAVKLEEQLEAVEPDTKLLMLRDLSVLYAGPLENIEQSKAFWEQRRALKPQDRESLDALHGLYTREEQPEQLLEIVDALLAQAQDDEQAALEYERAELLDTYLQRSEDAIGAWRIVSARGGDTAQHAMVRIEALLRETEQYDALDLFFSVQLGTSDTRESAAHAMVRRGILRIGAGEKEAAGVEDLLNVLSGFGDTPSAESADEKLRDYVTGTYGDAVDGLVKWHDARDQVAIADALLEERVLAHGEDEEGRWRQLVDRLQMRENQAERLLDHWIALQIAHAPDSDESKKMIRWARENEQSTLLIEKWSACLLQVQTVPPWWRNYLNFALGYEGHVDTLLAVLRRLRELDAHEARAINDAIEELLASVDRFQALIDAIVERAENSEDNEAASRFVMAAQVAELELDDAAQASQLYLRARQADPTREELVDELLRNLIAEKRWADVTQQLRDALEVFPNSPNAPQWQAQLARASSRAGEPHDKVLEALREASTVAPSAPAVAEGLTELAFEEGVEPEIARSAATLLLSLGVSDGEQARELHERIVVLSPDPERRFKALTALGDLLRHEEGHQSRAWDALAEAIQLQPDHDTTARRLERLAGDLAEWRKTSELFAQLGNATDGEAGEALLVRAVRIEVEENGNLNNAVVYQEDLLRKAGDSDERLAYLQRWYEELQAYQEMVATLDRRAALAVQADDQEQTLAMRSVAVNVTDEHLQDHDDTIARWRVIADEHPSARTHALQELSRIFRLRAQWEELDQVLEERIGELEDQETRHTLLREQATVREQGLNQPDNAILSYQRISREDLESVDALVELDRLFLLQGNQEARYGVIQERFGRTGNMDDRLELARAGLSLEAEQAQAVNTLFSLIENRTPVRDDALETLQEVSVQTPERLSVERWKELADILNEENLLAEAARANLAIADAVDNLDEQRQRKWLSVQQRCDAFDSLQEAAEMASSLWQEEGCPDDKRELVKTVVRAAQREALYAEAVEAFLVDHPDAMDAREDLVRWYVEDLPNDEQRRVHLGLIFESNPQDNAVYADLLAVTPKEEQAAVLRLRMDGIDDEPERQRLRAELGLALAISKDAEDQTEAQRLLEDYRLTQSTNQEVNDALRKLLARSGHWGQLANLIEEQLWLTDSEDQRLKLLVERARCREKEEMLPSMVVEGWFDVLTERPSQPDAIIALTDMIGSLDDPILSARVQDRLELAYERSERWEDLYELLKKRGMQATGRERIEVLQRAANIAVDQLQDERREFSAYCLLIAHDPSNNDVVERAVSLVQSADDKDELRRAIETALETATIETEQRTILRRNAALLRVTEPGTEGQAIEELSTLFDAQKPWIIVEDVASLYQEDPNAYVDWLEERANAVDDLELRIRLLRKVSETRQKQPYREIEAGAALESIYMLAPSVEGAEELDALYARAGEHEARTTFWRARLQEEAPIYPRAKIYHKLHDSLQASEASWFDRIKNLSKWRDALEAEEENTDAAAEWVKVFQSTAHAWAQCDEGTEQEGDTLDMLRKRAGLADPHDSLFKARIHVVSSDERADMLWDELVRQHADEISLRKAWETASTALEDAPERDARGANIERLAGELHNYEEAAALLRFVAGQQFETRYMLAVRAARIDVEQLELYRRATKTLESLLKVKPDLQAARSLLRDILDKNPRGELRQRVINALIQSATEPAEKASLSLLSAVAAEKVHDIREAKANAKNALVYDPGNAEVRNFLLERRTDPQWRRVVEDDLLPILRTENAANELQQVLEALAGMEHNPSKKAEYSAELAQVIARAAEGDGNLAIWLDALRLHPHSPSYLENASQAVTNEEDAHALIHTLHELVEKTDSDEVRASILDAIGHTQLEILKETESGLATLQQALTFNPRNERVLSGLEMYYLEAEDYEGLGSLLRTRLANSEEKQSRLELTRRLTTLLRGELKRPQDAAGVLEEYLQATGPDEALYEELRSCYQEANNVDGEITVLERLTTMTDDVDERIDKRSKALSLAMNHPGFDDRVQRLAEDLILDDPQHADALLFRQQVFYRQGKKQEALQAALAVLERHIDDDVASQVMEESFEIGESDAKQSGQLIGQIIENALERGLLTDAHMEQVAEWLPALPVSDQRNIVEFAIDAQESEQRHLLLVAALRVLRPSSDEELGAKVVEIMLAEPGLDVSGYKALAQWFETANQYDQATEMLQKVVDLTDNDSDKGDVLLHLAKIEEERGNTEALVPLFEQARACGSNSPALFRGLKRGYEREGRWHDLLDVLQLELDKATQADRVRTLRRMAAIQRDHLYDEVAARDLLYQAIQLGNADNAQVELVEVLVNLGQLEDAGPLISLLQGKELPRALQHRIDLAIGRIAIDEARWEDAKVALERAHGHAASHAGTLLSLAQTHIALREWSDAQEALQAALVNQDQLNNEEKATTFVLLARTQAQEGSVDRAQEFVTRALRLVPDLPIAIELEEELRALN